jgi:PleD family two-component response regulator
VSAGIAAVAGADTLENAINAADEALYTAKKAGRNRVERATADTPPPDGNTTVVRVA